MTKEELDAALTKVLSEHSHSYDSDCGDDFGCTCDEYRGTGYDYTVGDEGFAEHLKTKIMEALNFV